MFGNVTQRDVVDSVSPSGVTGTFTNSTFDGLWVEHYFTGLKTREDSSSVQFSNSRVRNTFADGIDFYGSTSHSTITDCTTRSTGDDGIAMWAQGDGADAGAVSQGNSVVGCVSQLGWFGNGFAIYGGVSGTLSNCAAADLLNFAGLQVSTNFVPATLPKSYSMSATISQVSLIRSGGNGFGSELGALLIAVDQEDIDAVSVDQVDIGSPTYSGIDFREIPAPADHMVNATFRNVTLSNIEVLGAPRCANVQMYSGGSAQFFDVCACTTGTSAPTTCGVTSDAGATFALDAGSCTTTTCRSF